MKLFRRLDGFAEKLGLIPEFKDIQYFDGGKEKFFLDYSNELINKRIHVPQVVGPEQPLEHQRSTRRQDVDEDQDQGEIKQIQIHKT